ncbi:hypothetical protein ACWEPN_23150 [Nonomuraea wenchangensis]
MSLVLAALRRASQWQRPLMLMVASMLLLLVVSAAGLVFDGRMPLGAAVWLKLLKLAVSLAVYVTTLAWMLSLPSGAGGGPPDWRPGSPSPGPPTPPSSRCGPRTHLRQVHRPGRPRRSPAGAVRSSGPARPVIPLAAAAAPRRPSPPLRRRRPRRRAGR